MQDEGAKSQEGLSRTIRDIPPRHIDWFTKLILVCSDSASQAGWALLAIGSIIFWNTVVSSEAKFWLQDKTINWQEKAGIVLNVDSTRRLENRIPVWRYEHSVSVEGKRFKGESYSVGKKFGGGQIAFIRYSPEDPSINHIIGLRRSPFSWRVNLLLVIPLLGLFLAFASVSYNIKVIRLLQMGEFTRGKLVSKLFTKKSVKKGGLDRPVYLYRFEFTHDGAIFLASCMTHRIDLVEDEESEIILYDKYNPSFNLVYDSVPNVPKIDMDGHLKAASNQESVYLFLPLFTLIVNLLFAIF